MDHYTSAYTTGAASPKEILEVMREATEKIKHAMKEIPDVYVMTTDTKEQIVAQVEKQDVTGRSAGTEWRSVYGVPFEDFPTMADVIRRASELMAEGKNVGVIMSPDDQV